MTTEVMTARGARKKVEVPDLVKALAVALETEDDPTSWDNTVLHVSDLSVSERAIGDPRDRKCARQLWLRLHGADAEPPSNGMRLMWKQGLNLEAQVIELWNIGFRLLGERWRIVHVQYRVDDDLPSDIGGTLDVEAHGPNGELVIIDIKSIRGRAFDYLVHPKDANTLQVQTYGRRKNADYMMLFYVDREGQNFAKQFVVPRDDDRVALAQEDAVVLRDLAVAPPIIGPDFTIRENKGPDAVVLGQPWQCNYCAFQGGACPGAVRTDHQNKTAGKITEDGFVPREGYEEYAGYLEVELARRGLDEVKSNEVEEETA